MNIKKAFAVINQMQSDGIVARYAIGGAIGATFYLEPSQTYDIDVFVILNPRPGQMLVTLQSIHDYLGAQGWTVDQQGNSDINGTPVQFLPAGSPLLSEALEQSVEHDYAGTSVTVFTAPHLAAVALDVGRSKDKVRLLQFLEWEGFPVEEFSHILERHGLLERWRRFKSQMAE